MGALLLCLVICTQVLIVGTVAGGGAAPRPPAMYVFGSSILDVGNNNYLPGAAVGRANRRYNGIDFPGSIPTGRFSNGYNIADYVAKNMGFACSPPAYLSLASSCGATPLANGINYASGGAGILDSTNAGNTIPLSKQVQYFGATKAKMVAAVGPRKANALISRSIFLFGIGNNDMYVFAGAERAQNRSAADQRRDAAALYASLISNYSATVTELYSMGARKLAIINFAAGFNAILRSRLAGLAAELSGLVYSLADSFGFTRDVLADPRASGYTDVADACCGSGRLGGEAECFPNSTLCANRDQHVFWDRAHLTQRTAFLIAKAFYNGPAKYTTPINFTQLAQSS
ncbi:GDSL esterase/lipase [Dichanthelium oligosanthes]|uniref:GDSL esterase/lipase n=1 Tax=Dichanthelium oligosanthes TaxID=888268 RepID=A0A1E5WDD4_9POAL|nr:GDSL esterase/lipase [Dichanthelium oligosanthes]